MVNKDKPKPIYPSEYGWARISHEGQIIDHLKKLGAVELKPPKTGTGFGRGGG